ncbi:MAG: EamA family transporter [Spirochaetaceae bacterium]|nr:EamA family transporter [Spirochaetaceae bacterium]
MKFSVYSFCTIFAGVLWGIISIFLKGLYASSFSALQVMFLRGFISSLLMGIFLFFKDKTLLKFELKDIWMFLGTGVVSLTFFSLCYFYTILESGASVAVILLYTSPIFVLLMSVLFFKEKITFTKILALCLTFVGCVLVSGIGSSEGLSTKGFFIGLCAGFGYALYSIFSRFALKKYDYLTVTFYTFLFSAISIIPFCSISQIPSLLDSKTILLSCGISLLCTVLPYIFYTIGLSGLETGKAAILVTVEPLVATLVGFSLWKESVSVVKIVGIIFILISILLLSVKRENQK